MIRESEGHKRLKLRLTSIKTKTSSKIIDSGDELHALVPYKKIYDSDGLAYDEENYYLVVSLDEGKSLAHS